MNQTFSDKDGFSLQELASRDWKHVSRETFDRIEVILFQLKKWSRVHNLIGPDERDHLVRRHVWDSLQLFEVVGPEAKWVDLGSGSGFPGLILGAALVDVPEGQIELIESIEKKCAYLRAASRSADIPVTVNCQRIEKAVANPVNVITARALASLETLLEYAAPWLEQGARAVFPKGQSIVSEIDKASLGWDFNYTLTTSQTDSQGIILELSEVCRVK